MVSLDGFFLRNKRFMEDKWFECQCVRCLDPTELGTFASAILCPLSSCSGNCLPVDCLSYTSVWRCNKCGREITSDQAIEITEMVQAMCSSAGGSIQELETCLEKITEKVHPRHYIAMQIKRMLMLMYGNCSTHR